MFYSLLEIHPHVFLLSFDSLFQLGMTFLRYSESVENTFFKNKNFTILEFMDWYVHNNTKKCSTFSFTSDFVGYNLHGSQIGRVFRKKINDWNKYDELMFHVYSGIKQKYGSNFYLIGTKKGDKNTFKHEFAHALWEIDKGYNKNMGKLMKKLPQQVIKLMQKWLLKNIYERCVHKTEIQAYFATGLTKTQRKMFVENKINIEMLIKPFQDEFNRKLLETKVLKNLPLSKK